MKQTLKVFSQSSFFFFFYCRFNVVMKGGDSGVQISEKEQLKIDNPHLSTWIRSVSKKAQMSFKVEWMRQISFLPLAFPLLVV